MCMFPSLFMTYLFANETERMLAVNKHLLNLLQHRIPPVSTHAAYCSIVGNALHSDGCSASDLHIAQAFNNVLLQFQNSLSMLILRAVEVQGNLDSVESRLDVVCNLVAMETGILMSEKSDILADILTVVGLHRRRISRLDDKLQALKKITRYHAVSVRYLAGAFSGLAELQESMEVLRSLVTGAGLVEGVPMEVLIDAFTAGIGRLRDAGRLSPTLETSYRGPQLAINHA